MFIAELFVIAEMKKEPPYLFVDEWMKEWKECVHNTVEISLENLAICNNLDEHGRHNAKWNKPHEKDKRCMFLFRESENATLT